jgi:hypothetical protein
MASKRTAAMDDDFGDFLAMAWRACAELDRHAKELAHTYPEVAWKVLCMAESAESLMLKRLSEIITDEPWDYTTEEPS